MKVYVDPEICAGSGVCEQTCPEVFELKDDRVSMVKVDEIPVEFEQACRQAADNCPTGAISVEE